MCNIKENNFMEEAHIHLLNIEWIKPTAYGVAHIKLWRNFYRLACGSYILNFASPLCPVLLASVIHLYYDFLSSNFMFKHWDSHFSEQKVYSYVIPTWGS